MSKQIEWWQSTRKTDSNWDYDYIFEQPRPGLKLQKLITYEIKDNRLIETTVRRTFYGNGDYQDSTETTVVATYRDFGDE